LGMLEREGHTIKSMLFELLRTFIPTDDHVLCTLLDELWAKGIRYSEIKQWSTRKAEEVYGGELRSLTSSTRGLHVSATHFSLGDLENISRNKHMDLFRAEAPYLWRLIHKLLDPEPDSRRRQWSHRHDGTLDGDGTGTPYDSEAQARYYESCCHRKLAKS